MNDYTNIGLDSRLRSKTSLTNRESNYQTALEHNLAVEPTPYLNRTAVSKGTIQANLGGILEIRDTTGGTVLLTVDPTTGAITLSGPITLSGTITAGTAGTFTGPVAFANQGTILNSSFVFTGGTTDGTAAVRMVNNSAVERLSLGLDSSGYSYGTLDEIHFKGNTSNRLVQNFGVVARLADTAGTNAFTVSDSNNVKVWEMISSGPLAMRKTSYIELLGTIADPGGGGTLTARLFCGTSGTAGKSDLRVEFPTGASVKLGGEP